ncbi:programmed cell death protein 2-like [Scyliorhinus canicula]|uniref:programmed cell death protein 2-like n=1 Tax=Scyliorhinus canicula TaxID=7830 RepID=UPI0018F4E109|nr:programmed cell death protein 2-like [Scyliorhinus canicula]
MSGWAGPRVLLGIRDAAIEGGSRCSWDTSKAGGTPDCVPGITMRYPDCSQCTSPLIHVVQVYCPLEDSPYHRTINVLACPRPGCWGRSESWKVLRSQCEETTQKLETRTENALVSMTARDWCDEADDWGAEDCPGPDTEGSVSLGAAEPTHCPSDGEVRVQTSRLEALSLQEKAQGMGLVTQTPVPAFQPFYISVMEEEERSLATGFSHEQKLLREYQQREGVNVEELAVSSCEDEGVTEKYEKVKARHGDRTFVKFMKRISSCPEQILRYCWNGSPLLISSPTMAFESAMPVCETCASPRVFEFQLMPALVNMLKSAATEEASVEFGTVLIYTCERSCWRPSNQSPLEERAFVQGDPDQRFFR